MKLIELINTLNTLRYNNSPSFRVVQSKQKELLEIISGNTQINKIDNNIVNRYIKNLRDKGNSDTTINTKLALLSALLTYAYKNNLIQFKPYIPTLKIAKGKEKFLSEEEIQVILNYCKEKQLQQLYNIILTGLNTGMRIGEILHLSWEDIDNNYIRIWKNKTNKPTSIPMNDTLVKTYSLMRGDSQGQEHGLIYSYSYSQVNYQFNLLKHELGMSDEISIHTLRHTFCSKLVQNGIPLTTIQRLANHKSYKTTLKYAHLANKQLEEAVNCLC